MDDKKHLTDCHFYSLGSCTKGDSCVFRHLHTPATIATTIICKLWRAEVCEDVECALRHPTLPRAIDGSLITCLYDLNCAKRDHCPYAHSQKFEPKPSIPGLVPGEDQPRLQLTLAPPSSEPRFVAKPTNPSTVANGTTETSSEPSSTKKTEDTEPPAKKPRPDLSRIGLLSKNSRQENAAQQSDAKPQNVSFVKSFQEILKQKEQDEKEKPPVNTTKPTPAPSTDVKPKPAPAAGRGEKRKAAEPTPKQEPKAKPAPTKAAKLNETQSVKQSVLARVGKAKPEPAKAAVKKAATKNAAKAETTTAAPKAPPSFGIKSLGELMKEREAQDPATSAAASVSDKPPAKTTVNPSVGDKRKLEQLEKQSVQTTAAPKPKPKPAPATTKPAATTTTTAITTTPATTAAPTTKPQEESFDDLEKELEELGVDLDAEEVADEDVDIEIDLGV